jgi:hypothetical protein
MAGLLWRVFVEFEWSLNQATSFGWRWNRRALACEGRRDSIQERGNQRIGSGSQMGVWIGWSDWMARGFLARV